MDKKSTALFLRQKGLNHSFRLKGLTFNGTLIELLNEYRALLETQANGASNEGRALPIDGVVGQSEQLKVFQKMVNETKGYVAISDELIDKHLKSL